MRVPQILPLFPRHTTGIEENLDLPQCPPLVETSGTAQCPSPPQSILLQHPQSCGPAGIGVGLWGHRPWEAHGCSSHSMRQLDIPTSIIMEKQLAISIYSCSLPPLIKTTQPQQMAINCAQAFDQNLQQDQQLLLFPPCCHGGTGPIHLHPGEPEECPSLGNAARQRTQPKIGTCVTETAFGETKKQATEDKGVARPEAAWLARRGDRVPSRAGTSQPVPRVLSLTTAITDVQGVGQGGRSIIEL